MAVDPSYEALDLHHVRYQKGDVLGYFLAWISILPIYASVMLFSHFVHHREIHSLFIFIGQQLAMFLALLLKNSIKQQRPETCSSLETCNTYGWPWQHTTLTFFLAAYLTLSAFKKNKNREQRWTVIGGAFVGSSVGAVWFWMVNSVFSGYFPGIEESFIGRILHLKDTSHIRNALKLEYDNARASRKNSEQKHT
ncbi:lipid phosphate phosphatase gamma-like [Mangifera indica]|uniref:lipid phosphate phosphatase gamma-like n=1 Tax=Mangifera indica TaxID=29780 RepID=UPI001CFA181B|nr:lipid phosphate phosphatase gamma-like [Mangifera indica]